MKMLRFVALVLTIAVSCAAPSFQPSLDKHWKDFMMIFNKSYNCQEEIFRRVLWEENLAKIIMHNIEADLGKHSYKMGINHLTDMSTEEINKQLNGIKLGRRPFKFTTTFIPPFNSVDPEEVDWRKEGLVTPVKNQEQCGSCWAFSTTGSLEGQHKKKTGNLVSLSEQNLIDCSSEEGDMGCNGGMMDYAFEYIRDNGGIDTEDCYPYEGKDDRCRYKKNCTGATATGYVDITAGDERDLRTATATVGPISVAIDASHSSFHYYSGGIYNEPECSASRLDHGVLIVGYGTENGEDYWLVKNSWGPKWGEKGYIKMRRNFNNLCGIASQASYPLV